MIPPLVDRDADAFALVVQCGRACEAALIAEHEDLAAGRLEWAASHADRAQTRAEMALFIASGGRHG